MFKVTIVVLIVQILTYLHCGNSSLIRSRSSSNSVNLDDTSAKQQQLQQYDSNWKEIFIQAVETNSKSHSPRKRHFARKLVKDLEGTLKSNNPFHYFRLGNRSVRGYVGEPGTEEREENENFFQRKWNDLRELLHRFKNWCKSWFRSEPAEELEPSDDRNHEHGSPKSHPPTDSKKSEHLGQNSVAKKAKETTGQSSGQSDIRRYMTDEIRRLYPDDYYKLYHQRESKIQIAKDDLSSLIPPSAEHHGKHDRHHESNDKEATASLLTRNIIDGYLHILSRDYQRFSYLDTATLNYVMSPELKEETRSDALKKAMPTADKTHFAVPINLHSKHWILITVLFDARTYSILDPRPKNLDAEMAHSIKHITGLTLKVASEHEYREIIPEQDTRLEDDDYNCGVFVCWLAKRFAASNSDHRKTAFDADKFRLEMFETIKNSLSPEASVSIGG